MAAGPLNRLVLAAGSVADDLDCVALLGGRGLGDLPVSKGLLVGVIHAAIFAADRGPGPHISGQVAASTAAGAQSVPRERVPAGTRSASLNSGMSMRGIGLADGVGLNHSRSRLTVPGCSAARW